MPPSQNPKPNHHHFFYSLSSLEGCHNYGTPHHHTFLLWKQFRKQSIPKNCQHFYVHKELGFCMQQIVIYGKCIISLVTTILHYE